MRIKTCRACLLAFALCLRRYCLRFLIAGWFAGLHRAHLHHTERTERTERVDSSRNLVSLRLRPLVIATFLCIHSQRGVPSHPPFHDAPIRH
ncbi:hypothetical protein F4808DRAFT_16541 [Astrocystis sublimbata]|nr:hypothetical protein F4808DRAFT_16541 [Astrocystis sublimbata]